MAAFSCTLVMAFLLGFFLETAIGLISFWFLEVSSLLFVYMLFSFFLSGHMFPLDMLPQPWNQVVRVLPLQYLAYFPVAVFLGKITARSRLGNWPSRRARSWPLLILCRVMWHRGVGRYSGFGG